MEIEIAEQTDELCPTCSAPHPLEIVYGMPDSELFEHAEDLGYALAGCAVTDEDPKWQCRACGTQWGIMPW